MSQYNDRFPFPIKLFDNDIEPEIESLSLNDYKNKDEMMTELDLNSHIDFDLSVLLGSGNDSSTEVATKNSALNKKKIKKFKTRFPFNFEKNINEIIRRMKLNEEEKKGILLDEDKSSEYIDTIWMELTNEKQRRRTENKEKCIISKVKDIKTKFKQGRKRKDDNTKRKRTKYSTYNIMKKIKNKIIHYLLLFINKLIKSLYTKEQINEILSELDIPQIKSYNKPIQVIKKIEHEIYAKKTKKDENLKFLSSTIKTYLSNKISKKFIGISPDSNEKIILKLLQDEDKKDIFNFIFNELRLEDWLNIFTYQRDLENYTKIKNILNEQQIFAISKNLIRIDNLLLELINSCDDKDKNYFHCFVILIFNFKEFLNNKESRKRKKKDEKEKNDIQYFTINSKNSY